MANNLIKRVIQGTALFTGLAVGTMIYGCTNLNRYDAAGALIQQNARTNPNLTLKQRMASEIIGGLFGTAGNRQHDRDLMNKNHENLINTTGKKYRPAPGYAWVNPSNQKDLRVMPEGVIFSNNEYAPAPGYAWVNPGDKNDLRVKKKQIPQTQIITFNKYVDLNNDGYPQKEEFFGLGKKVFDLNKENFNLMIFKKDYTGKFVFRSWTDTGKLIGQTSIQYSPNKISSFMTGPGYPTQGDFLDNLKGAGSGKYKISINEENGKVHILDIEIVSGKKINSSLDEKIIKEDLRE
ncbi:MAG: hypothetical protein KKG94_04030 [Nanoarchaeota archaeon]|nr:hypothetical protein [Nanoarchaeota archaeon]